MGDSDLEELRRKRLAQLESEFQGGEKSKNDLPEKEQAKAREEYKKQVILNQVLDQPARARLNTLTLCKPDKGKLVEDMLVQMATRGQIRSKLGESDLIDILQSVNAQTEKKSSVKFDRRRAALDSDDDF